MKMVHSSSLISAGRLESMIQWRSSDISDLSRTKADIVHSRKRKPINYQLSTINRKAKGFTLIELLIAITIIAILIGLGTYTWINAQEKGRDGKRKNELKEVQKALEVYAHINGVYPRSLGFPGKITCFPDSSQDPYTVAIINWGSPYQCTRSVSGSVDVFMQKLPSDPGTIPYYYWTPVNGSSYTLSAKLENTKDPELVSPLCTPQGGSGRNYCVTNP